MSKQDYELIASAIRNSENLDQLVDILCDEFRVRNGSFKPDLFREACKG
jgi:hypothetical protein